MYNTRRRTGKFDMDSREDMTEYEDILNNPLCTIISEKLEKVREEEFNEDTGRIARTTETLFKLVVWDEKSLVT